MNKILLVDESQLFRKFITQQLESFGFKVITCRSGFDGLNKLRTTRPDLVIIDDNLNRLSVNNFLKKKLEDINIKDIPVIFTADGFSQERIVELCRVKVRRFIVKPLKIDQFFSTVSSFFNQDIWIDDTECQLNIHVNDNLILVEIARGLNKTKLGLLQWKIRDIISRNSIDTPKIMLLISDVVVDDESAIILSVLLDSLSEIPDKPEDVKILTIDDKIKDAVLSVSHLSHIDVFNNLIEAIDAFFGKKGLEKLTSNQDSVHQIFLSTDDSFDTTGLVDLNFKEEQTQR
jgi:CheY-like chemotaxis protein